jgi:hypothetical protein
MAVDQHRPYGLREYLVDHRFLNWIDGYDPKPWLPNWLSLLGATIVAAVWANLDIYGGTDLGLRDASISLGGIFVLHIINYFVLRARDRRR